MTCVEHKNALFSSPLFEIVESEWHSSSARAYTIIETQGYSISFVRRGHFRFERGRRNFDYHAQVVQHHNSGEAYRATHPVVPFHQRTMVKLNPSLLAEMRSQFWRPHVYSDSKACQDEVFFPVPLSATTPHLDYLHRRAYAMAKLAGQNARQLELEILVLDLLASLFARLYRADQFWPVQLSEREIRQHLWRIEQAKEFIHENFDRKISLSDIARSAHLSECHFLRLFRRLIGVTPYQYLLEVRFHHSLMLLRHTNKTVTEICYESGFESLSHFIDTFGRRFGFSPSRARHLPQRVMSESSISQRKHRGNDAYVF